MKQVFAYRPPSAGRSLLRNSEGIDDDELEEVEETLRQDEGMSYLRSLIREHIRGLHIFGMSRGSLEDVSSGWPEFFSFLKKNHGDMLSGCTVAFKKRDKFSKATPYVLLPDHGMTVAYWNEPDKSIAYSQSEDLARALERFRKIKDE